MNIITTNNESNTDFFTCVNIQGSRLLIPIRNSIAQLVQGYLPQFDIGLPPSVERNKTV